jgi:hypothetical protein
MKGDLFELIELDALRCMHIYENMVNMVRTIEHHINSLLALEISDAPPIANANKKKQLANCRGSSLVIRVTSLTDNPAESIDILISDRVSGFPRINLATTVSTSTYDWLCPSHIISECGIIFWCGVLSHEWMKNQSVGDTNCERLGWVFYSSTVDH